MGLTVIGDWSEAVIFDIDVQILWFGVDELRLIYYYYHNIAFHTYYPNNAPRPEYPSTHSFVPLQWRVCTI